VLQKGASGKPLEQIRELARQNNVPIICLEKNALEKLTVTRNHQGVLAEASPFFYTPFDQLLTGKRNEAPFLLVLDHLQDPQNLGALLRSAYAAGCHGAVIPERRAAQVTTAAVKAAAGAADNIPVAKVVNLPRCLDECKEAGMWIYGADMSGEILYTDGDYHSGTVLVVGSEGTGLGRLVKEKCDHLIKLPMKGKMTSLNASVAGALMLYEVFRQRQWL